MLKLKYYLLDVDPMQIIRRWGRFCLIARVSRASLYTLSRWQEADDDNVIATPLPLYCHPVDIATQSVFDNSKVMETGGKSSVGN